jgi:hypothetical protein
MKRPADLNQLLEELEAEIGESSVEADKTSKAIIHTEYEGDDDDEDKGIPLTGKECKLLFHSEATVDQLYEALGRPSEGTVTLYNLVLEDEVIIALERTFTAVDEA